MQEKTFYTQLQILARQYNMSMNQLERELNLPRNALNNYKNNRSPSAHRLAQIARFFGVSMEYLLGETDVLVHVSIEVFFEQLCTSQKFEIYKLSHDWISDKILEKLD